ncbi:MAG: MG2 domain-containing protein, partial [Planctomycetota bacterium]
FKAIKLYQELLNFHAKDESPDARIHVQLERIRFAQNHALGEEKDARALSLLDDFARTNPKHPLSANARAQWAGILMGQNDLEAAYEVALQGKNAFPESIGGRLCHNIVENILSKAVNVSIERVWNNPAPNIRVRYKNISKLNFRIVQADWQKRLGQPGRWQADQITDQDRTELFSKPPIKAWSTNLEPTTDYQEATDDLPAPLDLKPGYYFLLYSFNDQFTPESNQLGACELWVSKLGLVLRPRNPYNPYNNVDGDLDLKSQAIEGLVVDNQTGEPIDGAKIQAFVRVDGNPRWMPRATGQTEPTGLFRLLPGEEGSYMLLVEHGEDRLSTQHESYIHLGLQPQPGGLQIALFTDRSIYRPGQTVYFKGVVTSSDRKTNRYTVVPGKKFTVQFQDTNGQVIETLDVASNDYGSFSGSLTAPRNRGTGEMLISIKDFGFNTTISVEEYKRPKFQVTLDRLKDQVKLDDQVTVKGKAISYTGAPIQGAKVRYRVVRQVRWPDWFNFCFYWRIGPFQGRSQEIARGWTDTNPDGSFQIEFIARPDRSVPEDDLPIFQYEIVADVTDTTGETRTGSQSVSVGYVTAQANLTANQWQTEQKPVEIEVKTSSLDGQEIASSGQIKIYKITQPAMVPRTDLL